MATNVNLELRNNDKVGTPKTLPMRFRRIRAKGRWVARMAAKKHASRKEKRNAAE